jgi:hypothetical protein
MPRLLLIALLFLSVFSAAYADDDDSYAKLLGQPLQNVMNQWGDPDLVVHTDTGDTYYTFSLKHEGNISAPGAPRKRVTGQPGPILPAGFTSTLLCTLIVKADKKNLITEVKTKGPQCTSEKTFTQRMQNPYH